MDISNRNKKLLVTILNKVFCIYNEKEYRKYFIESNFDVEDMTKQFIVFSDTGNRCSNNMYYHYYIYLTIVPDLLKEEIPDLLGE
nr:MAG TPA: hypothetical protein [Caudoviricetes sp.]